MLAEFLDSLATLVTRANGIEIEKDPLLPEKIFVRQGAAFSVHDVPPGRRSGEIYGLDDTVAVTQNTQLCPDPEVYYGARKVTILCDRVDRRDRFDVPLCPTEKFLTIQDLARNDKFSADPREMVKFLRSKLGPGAVPQALIDALRVMTFSRRSSTALSDAHGRDSLGSQVDAEVAGAVPIPEEFTVELDVFSNPGYRKITHATVQLGVNLNMQQEQVELFVLPDELQIAMDFACSEIGRFLRDRIHSDVPVIHGAP